MKSFLYLFNPENDMALACGDLYYMAPASARKMAADLSALPGWYAGDGATVLLATKEQVAWMEATEQVAWMEAAEQVAWMEAAEQVAGMEAAEQVAGIEAAACGEGTSALERPVSAVWAKGTEGRLAPAGVRWQCWDGAAPLTDGKAFDRLCPWGWNPSLVRRLREAGIPEALLPDAERMQTLRTLSGRQTAVRVLQRLHERWRETSECLDGAALLGTSFVLTTEAEVKAFVEGRPHALLKAPWSGSGRGVQYTHGQVTAPLQGWVRHVLHTQQAVVGEPFYEKVIDFAMEFRVEAGSETATGTSVSSAMAASAITASAGSTVAASAMAASAMAASLSASPSRVRFTGYSLFETDARGIYKENWLASDAAIEARLAAYVPVADLHRLRRLLEEELEEALQGAYEGYLGVDLMICRGSAAGTYALHPCVEINLRTNMGVLARRLYDNYVSPASQGRYVIEFYPQPGEALRRHQAMQEAHPLVVEDGRLRSGYFSLTPVFEDTAYQAYGIVEEVKEEKLAKEAMEEK